MKVLLIDDHPVVLSALQRVIQGLGDTVTVVRVDRPNEVNRALLRHPDLDLALLGLSLAGADAFELLAHLRRRRPAMPVVVVSGEERLPDVVRAIDIGAMGHVSQRAPDDELCEALRMVLSGGVHIPPALRSQVRAAARAPTLTLHRNDTPHARTEPAAAAAPGGTAAGEAPAVPMHAGALGLTPRQTEVMARLLRGLPNKLIARELNLSVDTVKDHVAAVLRALGVTTRTQAVLAVSQMPAGQQGVPLRVLPKA
ncbi:MAG: response regulator transcription factor [Burkholderiales bacterium]|nr:response regulator transcription factor [Burkholderiales bacterium]